jgi:membrane-bound metal-dependent hydrolase YbcI (DUF457 family)
MEPVLHFAIPFAIGSILRLGLRRSLLLGVIGILPDLDVLLLMHRSITHSITPSIILALISLLPRAVLLGSILRLSALGWASHTFIDFMEGYTPILWPLSQNSYRLVFESRLHVESQPAIYLAFRILEEPYNYGVIASLDAPIFTAEGLLIASLLTALALFIPRKRSGL